MDYSCYITVMNNTNDTIGILSYSNPHGTYDPPNPPTAIGPNAQIYFALMGGVESDGSEGEMKLTVPDGSITLAYCCPPIESNQVSLPEKSTQLYATYYSTNQPIQWSTDGSNWGPPDNFPTGGHPLYVLLAISTTAPAGSRS